MLGIASLNSSQQLTQFLEEFANQQCYLTASIVYLNLAIQHRQMTTSIQKLAWGAVVRAEVIDLVSK